MSRMGDVVAQTLVRRRLLENGYVPLANIDKMCVLPGWSHMVVDEAQIQDWSRKLRYRATGVRVEGGMAVIDIDVDDEEAVLAIIDALPEDIWAILQDAPVRRGRGAKEAWFCHLADGEEPFYRLASGGFRRTVEDEAVQRVEIFAGDGGRQFGAYGAHTIGDDGEVRVVYRWDNDRGLMQVPKDELPRITRAQLATVAQVASETLARLGWVNDLKSKAGFSAPGPIYDLDDQTFCTRDHGDVDLMGLGELCAVHGDVRLSASWIEGPSAVNTTRCIASLHPRDGRVSILETAAYEIHRPKDLAPKPVSASALDRLAEIAAQGGSIFTSSGQNVAPSAAPAAPGDAFLGLDVGAEIDRVVQALVQDVAFCPSEQKCVMPIDGGPERAMSLGNFKVLMQPWSVTVHGPRGGERVINPATIWSSDPDRIVVGGYRFRPDMEDRIIDDGDGSLYINLYRPMQDADAPEGAVRDAGAAFEALLRHLVPQAQDRAWFRMWLASKVQRPWAPNCGVLMIADQQGTGRGTLFDMMRVAVGRQYYRSISSIELLGVGGQGAYTDWAAQSILVTVEEVMAGADSGANMNWKRREAYERIKQLVDPRQRSMEIRRKGLQNYSQDVFFSLLMATNHRDALPLDMNDRRIAVLIQPEIRFDDVAELRSLVNPWRAGGGFSDAFGAALRQHLMRVDVDFDALRMAPELSGGRDAMRDSNEGDLEDLVREVLDRVPGDFIANKDLKRRMQIAVTAEGEGDHMRNWWVRVQDMLKRPNSFGWRAMPIRQAWMSADRSTARGVVYYREAAGDEAADTWSNASWEERRDVLLARGADVNAVMSAADRALRDGKLAVVRK